MKSISSFTLTAALAVMPLALGSASLGCGPTQAGDTDGGNGNGDSGTDNSDGANNTVDAGPQPDAEVCAQTSSEAQLLVKPVDIIFVIDNSGSMGEEIQGVQNNINDNFAQIIEQSGVDYRVIMLAHHGRLVDESVCIEEPLSGIPAGTCLSPPSAPVNAERFFHYSFIEVASHDSWCQIIDRFDRADQHGFAPTGYQEWLRPDAFKIFVEVTDDGVNCNIDGMTFNDANTTASGQSSATAFDSALLNLSPTHFGTLSERNYRWYSLIALANKDNNNPAEPWLPTDPLTTSECPTAADPGTGYQALSVMTGGLRFPLCEPNYYDVVFNEIAQGVIEGAAVDCEFAVPEPPQGEVLDLDTVVVHYTPGVGADEDFQQVASELACANNSFYIDNDVITLCPDTCDRVQGDQDANIEIRFGCEFVID